MAGMYPHTWEPPEPRTIEDCMREIRRMSKKDAEIASLAAELEATKIQYADCARLLEEVEAKYDDQQDVLEGYANELAALWEELNSITHVATTADPNGWWIAPRGSTDPKEWICVEEMMIKPQCPECGRDSVKEQWVCEHCGHRSAIDAAMEE